MFSQFRYWSYDRILFVLFYIALNVGAIFCIYKGLTSPTIPVQYTVLKKDSGINENGIPKYFVEVTKTDSNAKIYRKEIEYGFNWDTIDVKETIVLKEYDLITWIYGSIAFILLIPIAFFASTFGKLVLRLRD